VNGLTFPVPARYRIPVRRLRVFTKFIFGRSGTTAIEYALIGGLISVMIVAGATAVGTNINNRFYSNISHALS
jgi:pilus assembly protein Flp/PilA